MVHSGVLYISGLRRPPKRRGARGSLPPYPTLSMGLIQTLAESSGIISGLECFVCHIQTTE